MSDTIFSYLDSLLFDKKYKPSINYEENQYNNFMVNRWCSMYSSDVSEIINQTVNRTAKQVPLKEDHYKFLFYLLPKQKRRKIEYIKKIKQLPAKKEEGNNDLLIAKNKELSLREIQMYKDLKKSCY
jgi:hypothetical protein